MAVEPDLVPIVEAMFPATLHQDLGQVLAVLEPDIRNDQLEPPPFWVEGQRLQLLARFYSPEPAADTLANLSERQGLILACLYSRHHDGHVREAQVRTLQGDEPWLPVFVLRLVSEYVIEIARAALDHIDAIPRPRYEAFAAENPAFMSTTRSRIISYHDAYYRRSMELSAYPGYRFIESLGLWSGHGK